MSILTIDAGKSFNATHIFKFGDKETKLHIKKTETDEVVYKLMIEWEHIGLYNGFKVTVTDNSITYKPADYSKSSTKLVADVFGGIIRITERKAVSEDENMIVPVRNIRYANPVLKHLGASRPNFTTELLTITEPSGSKKALVQMAQRFKPADGRIATKVFYNEKVVVLQAVLQANEWDYHLYVAKVGENEFVKCDFTEEFSTGGEKDGILKLDEQSIRLEFPIGQLGPDSKAFWNGKPLKILGFNQIQY